MKAKIVELEGRLGDEKYYALDITGNGIEEGFLREVKGVRLRLPEFDYRLAIKDPHQFFRFIEAAIGQYNT